MLRLRIWVVLLVLWTFAIIAFLHTSAGSVVLSPAAVVISLVATLCLLAWPRLATLPVRWLAGVAMAAIIAVRLTLDYPPLGEGSLGWLVDVAAVAATTFLATMVARCLAEFCEAVSEVAIDGDGVRRTSFNRVQSRLYREVRRARHSGQPLTLLAVAVHPQDVAVARRRITEEAVSALAQSGVQGKVAGLLRDEIRNCGTIALLDRHLVAVLPSGAEDARKAVRELRESAMEKLGLHLAVGSALFPDQERTFVGLLEHAQEEMRRNSRRRVCPRGEHRPSSPQLAGHARNTEPDGKG